MMAFQFQERWQVIHKTAKSTIEKVFFRETKWKQPALTVIQPIACTKGTSLQKGGQTSKNTSIFFFLCENPNNVVAAEYQSCATLASSKVGVSFLSFE